MYMSVLLYLVKRLLVKENPIGYIYAVTIFRMSSEVYINSLSRNIQF